MWDPSIRSFRSIQESYLSTVCSFCCKNMSAHSFHASYYINIIKGVENKLMQKLLINGKVHYCCVAINICCDSKDDDVIFLNTRWGLYLFKKQPGNSTAGNANSVLVNATSMSCVWWILFKKDIQVRKRSGSVITSLAYAGISVCSFISKWSIYRPVVCFC